MFWVGPIVGALLAGILYELAFAQRHLEPGRNHREEIIASRVMDIEVTDLNQNNGTKAKV